MEYADFFQEHKDWSDSQWRSYTQAFSDGKEEAIVDFAKLFAFILIIKYIFL